MTTNFYIMRTGSLWALNSREDGFLFQSLDPIECAAVARKHGADVVDVVGGNGKILYSMFPTFEFGSERVHFTLHDDDGSRSVSRQTIIKQFPLHGWEE